MILSFSDSDIFISSRYERILINALSYEKFNDKKFVILYNKFIRACTLLPDEIFDISLSDIQYFLLSIYDYQLTFSPSSDKEVWEGCSDLMMTLIKLSINEV